MNSFARSLFLPHFFLGYGLSFSSSFFWHALWACGILSSGMHLYYYYYYFYFFTCLVGMWHTFFGYASFISFFFIARILDGNLEKESHVMAWSFIECMDGCACYLPVWKYSM